MKLGFRKLTDAERISIHSSVDEMRRVILKLYDDKCSRCGFNDIRALGVTKKYREDLVKINPSREIYEFIISNMNRFEIICANCREIEESDNKENKKAA